MHSPSPTRAILSLDAPRLGTVSRRFVIYGVAVELKLDLPVLAGSVEQLLGDFAVQHWPIGVAPLRGTVQRFEERDILRRLPPNARRISVASSGLVGRHAEPPEVFQDGERFWIVDERWGMAEIDLLKGRWSSWILPTAQLASRHCVETAIHWPLAQLLRRRGLHLLPVASVARGGVAALIIAPFNVGPELGALISAGYRLVGQRWTMVRDAPPNVSNAAQTAIRPIEMCQMPGWVDLPGAISWPARATKPGDDRFIDLALEHCGATKARSACNTVIIVQPTRRLTARLQPVPAGPASVQRLRGDWPLAELHPTKGRGQLASSLARRCAVYDVTLSRNPNDLPELLGSIAPSARPAVTVKLHVPPGRTFTQFHPVARTA